MSHSVVDVSDLQPTGPANAVRFVRRELGAQAFGINQFDLPPDFDGPGHDEKESGQEEVYVVIGGSGTMTIDGEPVELRPGRYVRVDPECHRQVSSGPDGLSLVAVGATTGAYTPRGPF